MTNPVSALRPVRHHRDEPLVSVIIPVFNQRRFLPQTVRCLHDQTHRNLELIFVDDGSTDGSGELLGSLADDRTSIIRQDNQGLSAARNTGLKRATGRFVQFLDADDLISEGKIAHEIGRAHV